MKRLASCVLIIVMLVGVFCINVNAAQTLTLGDINSDGSVSTHDVRQVLSKISGKALPEETAVLADYDFNGTVDKTDAALVLKCASGIVTKQALSFTDWSITVQPTCTQNGTARSVCEAKGLVRTKSLPKLAHSYIDGACSVCGELEGADGVIYVNSKSVKFGDPVSALTSKFGAPTEVLQDKTEAGTVKYYVYAQNYSKLAIFTCSDSEGVIGIYTNDAGSKIVLNDSIAFKDVPEFDSVDDVYLYGYFDELGTKANHAIYATTDTSTAQMSENTNFTTQEKLIFYSLNGTRAQNGKTALAYDTEFARVALYHSKDMATNDYFGHTSPSGEEFSDRLEMFGYSKYCSGENIATANMVNAYKFNDLWYNSEGHRSNMLLDDYTLIGIGIASGYNKRYDATMYYATQNFRWIYE